MARLSTCKKCEVKIPASEKFMSSGKTYCKECYSVLHRDAEAYKSLIDSICKVFDIEQPTGLILKQVKEYKNELKYTYAAMNYTMWYITEILRLKMNCKYGVALLKYNYDDAKNYFEQQQQIAQSVEKAEIKTKIIKKSTNTTTKPHTALVDIEKIIGGGDINKF